MKRTQSILAFGVALVLAMSACGGGGGGSSSGGTLPVAPPPSQQPGPPPATNSPAPVPTQAPSPSPTGNATTCPSSGPASSSIASIGSGTAMSLGRRAPSVVAGRSRYVPGRINVVYASDDVARTIDAAAVSMQARSDSAHLESLGLRARVISVDPSHADALISRLRSTAGVIRVERAQYRHLESAVSVNDPYYNGFGPGAPLFANAFTPGQWDMHLINVATAWGDYASIPAVGAPLAVIDTGVDVTHPDLSDGRVIRQACFVTFPSSAAQTVGSFAIDTDGHGTNVAGIADADTNNGFGFSGVAFDSPLLAYRIFPATPAGGCINSSSPQCSTTDVDEASAIDDAVAHGAKVINLSLGATGPLANCQDTVEENAVESAIAHGVVVVAAAGNGNAQNVGQPYLDCPAAYPGVIAVGAEGPAGASNAEAMASYSNYTGASGPGGNGVFLVAPGGTASSSADNNDLHFVVNITSSQMADAAAFCTVDLAGASHNCRAGFAGTSQATPHVTGVVSLMLGLRPGLTPAQIAADLCSTAHSIGSARQGCGRLDAAAAVAKALTQ